MFLIGIAVGYSVWAGDDETSGQAPSATSSPAGEEVGPGRDLVIADKADRAAAGCEVVRLP
jgi:hypothetical protein